LILAGDFNVTGWSYWFQNMRDTMKLRDTRQGFGIQPSWPVQLPILLIPIDHVLVSEQFIVLNRRTGKNVGSDHYPVYVELAVEE
jgi:endonuclease/exonuclease/phosphatase (EEP) superfamily protein YafD